ncbi:phytanoyl-CoA dioxygenase, peroxisomal-like isoform X2 [Macrosteles quadrilineatus]|uniref:phytanoyl-CoA dioxygenase, peroxisomal-like isoform X2 n=1 Tax=Macrosteles quadrilineatus TaxID=74068 RepID=UPI0023E2FE66|nr:phytanoyl-CoA dioxygenase, peroxisomal-like isoform X2 [Macrosteles quadrilineatus]
MNSNKTNLRLRTILGHLQSDSPSLFQRLYTHNSSRLTRVQRQFYEDNGYIVIKKLVNDDILDQCRDHFVDVCTGWSPAGGMFLMKEPTLLKAGATGEHLIYKVQDLLYDEVFSLYTSLPELLDYIQCFTGPNITAIHSMLINKPPDAEHTTIHPLHQDLLYFPFRPANLIVGAWTAMEQIDEENGCLIVCPGSHRLNQLYQHGTESFQIGPYKTFYGVKSQQKEPPVPLRMEKGDTVFLHPLLIHGSGPNRSKRFRKAISCHYAASECQVVDVKNTPQEQIAKELEATGERKHSVSLDFQSIMKLRSVVVRGSEGFTNN